jgi:hypothetical protein
VKLQTRAGDAFPSRGARRELTLHYSKSIRPRRDSHRLDSTRMHIAKLFPIDHCDHGQQEELSQRLCTFQNRTCQIDSHSTTMRPEVGNGCNGCKLDGVHRNSFSISQ